ncbi:MAG: translation initiation factor [Chthoniobacterales bacterium]
MAKKIPVASTHVPLQSGLGGFDFSGLGDLPPGSEASSEAIAPTPDQPPSKAGRVLLRKEKSGRGGKVVIVVHGFDVRWTDSDIMALGQSAKQSCGCGGTVSDRTIELQGDQPDRVRKFFQSRGFTVGGV